MQNNPFKNVSHLIATCPFCKRNTDFQCQELRVDVGVKVVNAEILPISNIDKLNSFAPYMCEHCSGLFYFGVENWTTTPYMFFGDSGLIYDNGGFERIFKSEVLPAPTHSIFIIRGTFGTGKTELSYRILADSPMHTKASIIEIEDQMGHKQSGFDIVKNEANQRSLAINKFKELLSQQVSNIIICGLLPKIKDVEDYLLRIEEAPLSYGVQIINLNTKKYKTQRVVSLQMIESFRERFEP